MQSAIVAHQPVSLAVRPVMLSPVKRITLPKLIEVADSKIVAWTRITIALPSALFDTTSLRCQIPSHPVYPIERRDLFHSAHIKAKQYYSLST